MNLPPLVVGISGNRSCGKDTLYHNLAALDDRFVRWAYADALKQDIDDLLKTQFGVDVWSPTVEEKELIRPILISYGCAHRAVDPDHWVKKVIAQINDHWSLRYPHEQPFVPVVTDIRFCNEAALMRATYGKAFIQINVTRKGSPAPTEEEEKHYRQVAPMANYHLEWGNETPEEQLNRAREVMGWLTKPLDTTP